MSNKEADITVDFALLVIFILGTIVCLNIQSRVIAVILTIILVVINIYLLLKVIRGRREYATLEKEFNNSDKIKAEEDTSNIKKSIIKDAMDFSYLL